MMALVSGLPNLISLLRIFFSVYAVYLIVKGKVFLGIVLFVLSALSDFFDGYLARKYNWITEFGKLIDPISDKVLVLSGFVLLAVKGLLPWVLVVLVAIREVGLTFYRLVVIHRCNVVIPAFWWGKCKTTVQMLTVALGLFFIIINFSVNLSPIGLILKKTINFLGLLSLFLSFYSGYLILSGKNGSH